MDDNPYVPPLLDDKLWNAIQEFDDEIENAWGDLEYGQQIMGVARKFATFLLDVSSQLAVETETETWDRLPSALKDLGLHDEILDAMQIAIAEAHAVHTRGMAERSLELTRLVISARPRDQVLRFLRRVSRCYILGLAAESIILCRSSLDVALADAFDRRSVEPPWNLKPRLDAALILGLIDVSIHRDAVIVKQRGDTAVHKDPEVPKDALGTIQLTMRVLTALYATS